MRSKTLLITSGVIAAVAAAALLVPSLAFGQPLGSLPGLVPIAVVTDDDRPGNGQGNAWGHHKDSEDFPGRGRGLDKNSEDFPGQGNAWGHHKDSEDFPGQGRGLDKDPGDFPGQGNAYGHEKGRGNPHAEDD